MTVQLQICYRLFFFCQAEDGIRDADVTGVQTCALPISGGQSLLPAAPLGGVSSREGDSAPPRGPWPRRQSGRESGRLHRWTRVQSTRSAVESLPKPPVL